MPKPKASSKHGKAPAAAPQTASAASRPDWPQFKPPLPVVDLAAELHPATAKIALIPSFFPRSLCRDYVTFLKTLPLQTTPSRPKRGEAVRVNDRFQIEDDGFAKRLWERTGLREALLGNDDLKDLWFVAPACTSRAIPCRHLTTVASGEASPSD